MTVFTNVKIREKHDDDHHTLVSLRLDDDVAAHWHRRLRPALLSLPGDVDFLNLMFDSNSD